MIAEHVMHTMAEISTVQRLLKQRDELIARAEQENREILFYVAETQVRLTALLKIVKSNVEFIERLKGE